MNTALYMMNNVNNVEQEQETTTSITTTTTTTKKKYYIGIDLGTSGARISIIVEPNRVVDDTQPQNVYDEIYSNAVSWNQCLMDVVVASGNNSSISNNHTDGDDDDDTKIPHTNSIGSYDEPKAWCDAVEYLFECAMNDLSKQEMQYVQAICFSGTSSSCLLVGSTPHTNNSATTISDDDTHNNDDRMILVPSRGKTARMYNFVVGRADTDDTAAAAPMVVQNILQQYVPDRHTAQSMTSTLAKLLLYHVEAPIGNNNNNKTNDNNHYNNSTQQRYSQEKLCHQADYIIYQWLQIENDDDKPIICSDWHNCLKLGYDVQKLQWPDWLIRCLDENNISKDVLPHRVVSPGTILGTVRSNRRMKYGLPPTTVIVGGTTDSNAAFFAATAVSSSTVTTATLTATTSNIEPGIAVSSLGSTVALKQLSTSYVEDATRGVYSHRFPSTFIHPRTMQHQSDHAEGNDGTTTTSSSSSALWLVGGASNVGCAILRKLNFTNDELDFLSQDIDPTIDSPLSYYPLLSIGERFPIADRDKKPILEPIPLSRQEYLHGLLQSISDVERDGYIVLGELGVRPSVPSIIWTCGGGSRNTMWTTMRQRRLNDAFRKMKKIQQQRSDDDDISSDNIELQTSTTTVVETDGTVSVLRANNVEASYGAAILAASSFRT